MTVIERANEIGTNAAQVDAYTDIISSKLRQMRGRLQESWGALTNSDQDRFYGRRDQLVGLLQEKYGYTRLEAIDFLGDFIEDALTGDEEGHTLWDEATAEDASARGIVTKLASAGLVVAGIILLWKNR